MTTTVPKKSGKRQAPPANVPVVLETAAETPSEAAVSETTLRAIASRNQRMQAEREAAVAASVVDPLPQFNRWLLYGAVAGIVGVAGFALYQHLKPALINPA